MRNSNAFVVERKWMTASDIVALQLVPQDGQPVPKVEPGSHIEVFIDRPGESQLVRHYSLCNGPDDSQGYLIAVKHEQTSRGGSAWVHTLSPGDVVRLGTPRNHFPLAPKASIHILVGAGIGITPLLSMAQALHARKVDFELHYFVRGQEHIALREQLQPLFSTGRLQLHLALNNEEVNGKLAKLLDARDEESHLYHCGPGPFMDAVERLAVERLSPERVHSERFQAPAAPSDSAEFVVRLCRQGFECTVPPTQTIAEALAAAGHEIDLSCEQGVCGTCLTKVLEGQPDHRDAYLSKAEREGGKLILPCVSRSRTPVLVLDL